MMKKMQNYRLLVILLTVLVGLGVLSVSAGGVNLLTASSSQANAFQLPKYETFVLKNGLTVYLMEQHEVPLIYVSAIFPAGAVKDNGKSGLASLTAETLLLGSKSFTKSQLEEKLDFFGVSYSMIPEKEAVRFSMSFVNTDAETLFPILKEIIVYPSFDINEFNKYKKRLMLDLERIKEEPSEVIQYYSDAFLFGAHPYANSTTGSKNSVEALTLEDVQAFYHANYKPAESAIALVGDFKTPDMKKMVLRFFEDWNNAGKSTALAAAPLPDLKGNRVLLVNKDDAIETQFNIEQLGIKRSNPDYVAVEVINTILGGRFTSWLNDELRVNAGLTYGAHSMFNYHKEAGSFVISSYTPTATTTEALDLALKVMDRLHNQGIDEATLNSAKSYIKGQFPPQYETAGNLADLLVSMFFYGFNESFINTFSKNVDELTVEKAKQIVKNYFSKENLQFVLIGKASEIKEKVKKYGEIFEKEIKTDGF